MSGSTSVGTVVVDINANIDGLQKAVNDGVEILNKISDSVETVSKKINSAAKESETTVANLFRSVKRLGVGLFAGVTASTIGASVALYKMGRESLKTVDALAKLSDSTGYSVEFLQSLKARAQQFRIPMQSIDQALYMMTRRIGETVVEGSRLTQKIRDMGYEINEFAKLNADEQFLVISEVMKKTTNEMEKMQLAQSFLSVGTRYKDAAVILPLIQMGAGFFKEMQDTLAGMGVAISRVDAYKVEMYNQELQKTLVVLEAIKNKITIELVPIFSLGLQVVNNHIVEFLGNGEKIMRLIDVLKFAFAKLADGLMFFTIIGSTIFSGIALAVSAMAKVIEEYYKYKVSKIIKSIESLPGLIATIGYQIKVTVNEVMGTMEGFINHLIGMVNSLYKTITKSMEGFINLYNSFVPLYNLYKEKTAGGQEKIKPVQREDFFSDSLIEEVTLPKFQNILKPRQGILDTKKLKELTNELEDAVQNQQAWDRIVTSLSDFSVTIFDGAKTLFKNIEEGQTWGDAINALLNQLQNEHNKMQAEFRTAQREREISRESGTGEDFLTEMAKNSIRALQAEKEMIGKSLAYQRTLQIAHQQQLLEGSKEFKKILEAAEELSTKQIAYDLTKESHMIGLSGAERRKEELVALHDIDKETQGYKALSDAIDGIVSKELIHNLNLQYELLGKTRKERALLEMERESGLQRDAQAYKEVAEQMDRLYEKQIHWRTGMREFWDEYVENARDSAKQMQELMGAAFKGLEDALVDFVKTGKLSLESLLDLMAEMILRMAIQQSMASLFGGWFGKGAAFSNGTQTYAQGAAFSRGVEYFAGGGVVSKPTAFELNGGRLGIMGEAGPEAIMPLSRGADGKLGVEVKSSKNKSREITVKQDFHFDKGVNEITRATIWEMFPELATATAAKIREFTDRNGG